jgi:site-specific recombinase XerD
MLQKGATLKEIADILGHSSIDTTAIYAKVDLPTLSDVCNALAGGESMNSKNSMTAKVQDYLTFRRSLGFQFRNDKDGGELLGFGRYADKISHQGPITTNLIVQWARGTGNNAPIHWARRFDLARGFARHRALFEPETEVPHQGMLGSSQYPRRTPYIYSQKEIIDLLAAASRIRSKIGLTPRSYATLFGLLACSGIRVSEALALTNGDVDFELGLLKIRESKFQKSRLVPLHPSGVMALRKYSEFRDRFHKHWASRAFFLRDDGTPFVYYHIG